ncbi:MAG: nickel ABC transporter substrate-binding protein [Campylobacter sp.]|nr:nickel ABC transporter substrate-binding protein [Campylobacter sp.]
MIKKILFLFVLALYVFGQDANKVGESLSKTVLKEQASTGETLNFAITKNVGELNPHLYSPNAMFAQDMLYEGLTRYGDDNKIYPHLATAWQISQDGKTYKFTLRKDVVFSNGEKFDAKAVKANFDAILQNRKRHAWLELANIITDTKVLGEYEISLELSRAYSPTLRELSLIRPFRFIAPSAMKNASTKDGIKAPIGTGAWRLVQSKQGVSDTFEKNELYWGQKPYLGKIVAKVIPDSASKIIALQTGEISLIYGSDHGGQGLSPDSFNALKKDFGTINSKPLYTLAIALNSNKFPTNSKSVRQALNMAIDKDLIVKKLFFNTQEKADFLFAKSFENADINATPYAYDTKKAKQLLQDDGWVLGKDNVYHKDNKALKIELVYIGDNPTNRALAEVLQGFFKKIGVVLELKADESSIFYKKQQSGDFGAIFNSTWGAPYDPAGFLASMRVISHADYQAQLGLKNKADIDAKITQILSTQKANEARKLTHEVLNILHDEAIYIPLVFESNKVAFDPYLDGVTTGIIKEHIAFEKMKFKDKK